MSSPEVGILADGRVSLLKFDPAQARDDHGRWATGADGARARVDPSLAPPVAPHAAVLTPAKWNGMKNSAITEAQKTYNVDGEVDDDSPEAAVKNAVMKDIAARMSSVDVMDLAKAALPDEDLRVAEAALKPGSFMVADTVLTTDAVGTLGSWQDQLAAGGGMRIGFDGAAGNRFIGKINVDTVAGETPQVRQDDSSSTHEENLATAEQLNAAYPGAGITAYEPTGSAKWGGLQFPALNADGTPNMAGIKSFMANADGLTPEDFKATGGPEAVQRVREQAASAMVAQWAETSNDSNTRSLAIQQAAVAEFGLKDAAPWRFPDASIINPDGSIVGPKEGNYYQTAEDAAGSPHQAVYQAFVRAQYDATQEMFAKKGISQVDVYRGVQTPEGLPDDTRTVTMTQGSIDAVAQLRPLSSWATTAQVAGQFAGDYSEYLANQHSGYIFHARVPVDQVLSTSLTGTGCLGEDELVLLGRNTPVSVSNLAAPLIPDVPGEPIRGYEHGPTVQSIVSRLPGALPKAAAPNLPMVNVDANDEMADWPKRTWDLPTDAAGFLKTIGGLDKLAHFMTLPAARAMPAVLHAALTIAQHNGSLKVVLLADGRVSLAKFNADQPRDDHGRFTSDGSSGSSGSSDQASGAKPGNGKTPEDKRVAREHDLHAVNTGPDAQELGAHTTDVKWTKVDPVVAARVTRQISTLAQQWPNSMLGELTDVGMDEPNAYAATDVSGLRSTIMMSPHYFSDPSVARAQMAEDIDKGYHIPGTGTPEGIAAHEFGHVLVNTLSRVAPGGGGFMRAGFNSNTAQDVLVGAADSLHLASDDIPTISKYAETSMDEYVAEAFGDAVMNGGNAQPISKAVYSELKSRWDNAGLTPPTSKMAILDNGRVRILKSADPHHTAEQVAADADNLYHLGHSHHTTGHRWLGVTTMSKYSADQARDDHGRWTSGGASGLASPSALAPVGQQFPGNLPTDPDRFPVAHVTPYAPGAAGRDDYRAKYHIGDNSPEPNYDLVRVNPERARAIADAYQAAPLDDLAAHPAYAAMATEIGQQYDYMTKTMGVTMQVVPNDPYKSVAEMVADVRDNHVIKVLDTASTGSHPFFTDEQNNQFRAVHDLFGHASTGRGFDRHGEEAAWLSHSRMFSDLAREAMTTETRGQNSVLTQLGTGFPPQKVIVLPNDYVQKMVMVVRWLGDGQVRIVKYSADQARDARGRWTSDGAWVSDPSTSRPVVDNAIAGGFTVDAHTGRAIKSGIAVARLGAATSIPLPEVTPEHVTAAMEKHLADYHAYYHDHPDVAMGGWVDTEHKDLLIEPSDVIHGHDLALATAQARDQIGMFDLGTSTYHDTGGTGGAKAQPWANEHPRDLATRFGLTYTTKSAARARSGLPHGAARAPRRPKTRSAATAGGADDRAGKHRWLGWEHDEALAAHWSPRLAEAFQKRLTPAVVHKILARISHPAAKAASTLDPAWFTAHVNEAATAEIRAAVDVAGMTNVARHMVTQAWILGGTAARDAHDQRILSAGAPPLDSSGVAAMLQRPGLQTMLAQASITIKSVAANRIDALASTIADGLAAGSPPDVVADQFRATMDKPEWADTVARTEMARAQTQSAMDTYNDLGVQAKSLLTAEDRDECKLCLENEDAGDIPIDQEFPNGDPPTHPNCRCVIVPAPPPPGSADMGSIDNPDDADDNPDDNPDGDTSQADLPSGVSDDLRSLVGEGEDAVAALLPYEDTARALRDARDYLEGTRDEASGLNSAQQVDLGDDVEPGGDQLTSAYDANLLEPEAEDAGAMADQLGATFDDPTDDDLQDVYDSEQGGDNSELDIPDDVIPHDDGGVDLDGVIDDAPAPAQPVADTPAPRKRTPRNPKPPKLATKPTRRGP